MAQAVVSFAVERLRDLSVSEAKFLLGIKGEIEEIQREMKRIQCFLEEADKKQNVDKRVQNWVAEMRELAFKTEDVIETFAYMNQRSGFKEWLLRCACILSEGASLHKVGTEIKTIRRNLCNLAESLPTYGITKGLEEGESSTSVNLKNRRIIYFHDVEKDFVGMEEEVEQIICHLKKKDKHCEVVSICGMGGQGKTTVAKQIYNHAKVRAHFEAFGSVCISQQFDRIKILKGILEQLLPEGKKSEVSSMGDQVTVQELYKVQQEKNCLILIDDIWTMGDWKKLCPAFPIGVEGSCSKILLTTRYKRVAEVGSVYKLPSLTKEEGWQLLSKKAFSLTTGKVPVKEELCKMEIIGKQMVERCKGLPLAVSTMGGMLRGKTLREWNTIYRDIPFHLARGEGVDEYNTVTHVLGLSYDDLPPRLQQCFLCLSNYREDEVIKVEQLYLYWLGEGLISTDDKAGGTMLEVAERYLNELAYRSLVEVEPWEYEGNSWSKFKNCSVHDLVREVCLSKVKDEKVIMVTGLQCKAHHDSEASNNKRVRRMCIRAYDNINEPWADENVTPQVRSLFVFNERYARRLSILGLEKFKLLRVLTVQGFKLSVKNLSSITKLVYLKYLSFKECEVEELPSSIGNLRNLETLDLRITNWSITIPNILGKFKQLKHLYLPVWSSSHVTNNVRLDGLDELELIEGFDSRYCETQDLTGLSKIKVFGGIIRLDEKKQKLIQDIIDFAKSKELCHSSLEIRGVREASSLISLLECPFIDNLGIIGRITALPKEYEQNLSSARLISLELWHTYLEEDSMILLEKLPNLHCLKFKFKSYMGRKMVCSTLGFPQLLTLELNELPNLTDWWIDEGAMPNLSELHISKCQMLKMLPDGLRFLTALKRMYIIDMPTAFGNRIDAINGVEGPDFDKVLHVPSIHILLT